MVANAEKISIGELPVSELGVSAPDKKTFVIELEQPCPYLNSLVSLCCFSPCSREFVNSCSGSYASSADTLLSCGPYVMDRYEPLASQIHLSPNKYYYKDAGITTGVNLQVVGDAQQALMCYETGMLDVIRITGELADLAKDDPHLKAFSTAQIYRLDINHQSNNALKNLNDLIKEDDSFDPDAFYRTAYEYGKYRGKQYALPIECAPNMMFVNKSILDREKIDLPAEDWTWDDFYRICRIVTRDTDGTGIIDQFGTVNYSWIDAFDANGVELFDETGKSCDFTVREIGDAIAFLEKLSALGSGNSLSERNFSQGNVVFQPMLFSEYRAYKSQEMSFKKYSGFEWDCVTMPAGPSGDNYSRLDTLSIAMSENTTQKEMAWEFMKLLTTDPQIQSEIFEYSAGISVLPEVTQSEETRRRIRQSTGAEFNLDILESAMEKSVTRTRFRGFDNAQEEVGLAVRSILESNSNIQMEQIIWNRTINNYLKYMQQRQ
jgi:multiple sugar transport system substrate-binding protein